MTANKKSKLLKNKSLYKLQYNTNIGARRSNIITKMNINNYVDLMTNVSI